MDRRVQLKIKIKSLAAEARIIRLEELRGKAIPLPEEHLRPPDKEDGGTHPWRTQRRPGRRYHFPASVRHNLYLHRISVVRPEARLSGLAYGFIRGKTYDQIETVGVDRRQPNQTDWGKVLRMVEEFGVIQTDDMSTDAYRTLRNEQGVRFVAWVKTAKGE